MESAARITFIILFCARELSGELPGPDEGARRRSITGRTGLPEGRRQGAREKREDGFTTIEAIESETELFARAEQVDLAEKDFHDALAHRNEAQIAYLREPSNLTHVALEAAKIGRASPGIEGSTALALGCLNMLSITREAVLWALSILPSENAHPARLIDKNPKHLCRQR
jgi:hypothetical protein